MSSCIKLLRCICILSAQFVLAAQSNQEQPLNVCDLLKHVDRYRDKEVHVRGELREGPEEFALYGDDCKSGLVTNGHAWPIAVWLTAPDGVPAGRVDFKLDEEAVEGLKTRLQSERAAGKHGKVLVTVIGKFEARKKLFGGPNPRGDWIGNGFGHLNGYPGQIVIRTVEAAKVSER
jgi:hypothetical protein